MTEQTSSARSIRIDVLSIFPALLAAVVNESILKIAQHKGALDFYAHDLRDWTDDFHRSTDDSPYGGGAGMVMKVEPLAHAIEAITAMDARPPHTVFLAPVGRPFTQKVAQDFALQHDRLLLVCGRYEGFDERAFEWADDCLSIGDYVLAGGELPALVITEAVVRLLPSVLGNSESCRDESFSAYNDGYLEYPQYTRPASFRGHEVPPVLLSGNHADIAAWRRAQSIERTKRKRPDLL